MMGILLVCALILGSMASEPEDCKTVPKYPDNGEIKWDEETGPIPARTGVVRCGKGYKLPDGTADKVMCVDAKWVVPRCVIRDCSKCGCMPKFPTHGKIEWDEEKGTVAEYTGRVTCKPGYQLKDNKDDKVVCKDEQWVVPGCTDADNPPGPDVETDDSKIMEFAGITYNYTEIAIPGNSKQYPLSKELAYMFVVRYTANKATPTVRVHVGLVGKPSAPVLINIQQSSESVGFELPYKVVSSDNRHPLAPYTSWVHELCPSISRWEEEHGMSKPETVVVTVRSTVPSSEKLKIALQITAATHVDITDEPASIKINPKDQAIYRYAWPDGVTEAEINFGHKMGAGEDVCATASIRTAVCPVEEIGVSDLTFTRQGSFTLQRSIALHDGFILLLTVLPDDGPCRSNDREHNSAVHRDKTVTVSVTAKSPHWPISFLYLPVFTCAVMVFAGYLFVFCSVRAIGKVAVKAVRDTPAVLSVVSNPGAVGEGSEVSSLPPFDRCYVNTKQVDVESEEDLLGSVNEDNGTFLGDNAQLNLDVHDPNGVYRDQSDRDELIESASQYTSIFDKVPIPYHYKEQLVHFFNGIGHYGIPIVIFMTNFDDIFDNIKGNLNSFSVQGNQDACYYNAKCAFPVTLAGYRIPDISRVTSNLPYIVGGLTFLWIVAQKQIAVKPFDRDGKGIRHDFSLFSVLGLINIMVGVGSAVYHTCPNETTSRIDMFFIEMLLAYISLKLYQSRTKDIGRLFYGPSVVVTALGFFQRMLGVTPLAWVIVGAFHIAVTVIVCSQLFFLQTVTLNPVTFFTKCRHDVVQRIHDLYRENRATFVVVTLFFSVAFLANIAIAVTAILGLWKSYAMYNVLAIAADILVYFLYYCMMKYKVHGEKLTYLVWMLAVGCTMFWTLSVGFFLAYKSTNTSLSPAESRCYNKECIYGPLEGHDIWHCLSSVALLLTNVLCLSMDDDLITVPTERIPVF